MKEKLLSCPFCGGQAELDTRQPYYTYKNEMGTRIAVYCTKCNADMGVCLEDVPEIEYPSVIEMWNTRPSLRTHNEKIARAVWEAKTRTFAIGTRDNGHEDPFIRGEVVSKYKYPNFDDFLQSPEYKELVGE